MILNRNICLEKKPKKNLTCHKSIQTKPKIRCKLNLYFFLFQNKRLFDEKEKPLQKKVGELQSQVLKLERKTMILKTENESLVSIMKCSNDMY